MAIGRGRNTVKPRKPQINVTVSVECVSLLRGLADELEQKPSTLAGELLEQALLDRAAGAPEDTTRRRGQPDKAGSSDALLRAVLDELQRVARRQKNGTLKLLRQSGMTVEQVNQWAKERMK